MVLKCPLRLQRMCRFDHQQRIRPNKLFYKVRLVVNYTFLSKCLLYVFVTNDFNLFSSSSPFVLLEVTLGAHDLSESSEPGRVVVTCTQTVADPANQIMLIKLGYKIGFTLGIKKRIHIIAFKPTMHLKLNFFSIYLWFSNSTDCFAIKIRQLQSRLKGNFSWMGSKLSR